MNPHVVHIPVEADGWPVERQWKRLDEVTIGVWDCPHSTPKLTDSGPYVVRSQDIRSGIFRYEDAARVSEQTYQERILRAEPSPGDILYSREGTYFGIAAEMPDDKLVCLGQRMVLIRPNLDDLNTRFLRLWLNSPVLSRHIHGFREGTVAERLNMPTIRGLPIPVFGRNEQDCIAELLGSFDDKIELNRRINETLEAMAQAIFRDWFVDFGPSRRKMEGATNPVAILGGLIPNPAKAAALAALFPTMIADGGLPEGWESAGLSVIAALNPESWSARNHPDNVEYVDLANTKWGTIETTARYSWSDAPSRARRIVRPGDTVVGTVRPGNGSYTYIGRNGLTASTGFAVLRPKQDSWRSIVYCCATRKENIDNLALLADGGAYPAVRPEVVLQSEFNMPSEPIMDGFSELTIPIIDRVEHNKAENTALAATRDLLLPKLMSGEIRLHDEKEVA